MRVLITGVTGFAGGYLTEALLARGRDQVAGLSRRARWSEEWAHLDGRIDLRSCDLLDLPAVEAVLRDIRPEQIYHLAGYAHVGKSFREPRAAWDANLTATLNLFDAVLRWGGKPRILHVSTGLLYGDPEGGERPLDESAPLRPDSPYAASKAAADLAAFQYSRAPELEIVRVRSFNHIGPRQSPQYAVGSFARQIAAISAGRQPPRIETGDLTPRRDLTDVRDMVAAYLLLMDRGRAGDVYNAGTGEAHSIQQVLDRLLALAGIRVEVRPTVERRAADPVALLADAGKLRRETGWAPGYSLTQSLTDTLDYWRHRT